MKFVLILSLFMAACSSTQKTNPTKEGAIATMMEKFYGNYDPATKKSILAENSKAIQKYQKRRGSGMFVLPGDEISCKMEKWLEISASSGIVISSCNNSIGGDCQACAPVMGAALLSKNKSNNWEIVHGEDFVGDIGRMGKMPEPMLVKLGQNIFGISFDLTESGQGSLTVTRHLYSAEAGFKKLLEVPFAGSNAGNCGKGTSFPCYTFKSTMILEEQDSSYGPVRFKYEGTEPLSSDPKMIRPADIIRKYCYANGVYVRPCAY